MSDTPAKRMREAKKRQKQQVKAERKRLRKAGLLGNEDDPLTPPDGLMVPDGAGSPDGLTPPAEPNPQISPTAP